MPERPEVETIIKDLNKNVRKLKITNIWTDWIKIIKKPEYNKFVNQIKGKEILRIKRRGKYILFYLSDNKILIIHQKISGHLLYGKWQIKGKEVMPVSNGPLKNDSYNKYIRLIFYLNNGKMLGLRDLRRFAKVLLVNKGEEKEELENLGPEPLKITFRKFIEILGIRFAI